VKDRLEGHSVEHMPLAKGKETQHHRPVHVMDPDYDPGRYIHYFFLFQQLYAMWYLELELPAGPAGGQKTKFGKMFRKSGHRKLVLV